MPDFSRRQTLASIASLGGLALTGTASASTDGTTTGTTTGEPTQKIAVQVSPATHVEDYTHRGGRFELTVYSAITTTLTMSESVIRQEAGAGQFNVRQVQLERGTTKTSIAAPLVDGMAVVTLTTPESINAGTGAFLQTGAPGLQIFDGSATWGLTGIASAASFGSGLWGSKRWREKKRDEQDEREVQEL
jgi:hypothetical protein